MVSSIVGERISETLLLTAASFLIYLQQLKIEVSHILSLPWSRTQIAQKLLTAICCNETSRR